MKQIDSNLSLKLSGINVLLTLLIVWLHVSPYYDVPKALSNIAVIAVPCFFALSSFWYFLSFDFEDPWNSYKTKFYSRIKSLLIPFLIFNLLGLLFNLFAYKVHPVGEHPLSNISSISDAFYFVYESKSNGPLWYLRSLFMFIIFAPLLGFIIKATKWSLLLLGPLYIVCRNVGYFYFPYWMVDIFLGAYFAIYFDDIKAILDCLKNPVIKLVGVISRVLAVVLIEDDYTLRALVPICMVMIVCVVKTFPMKFLAVIAPYSMLIYCLHLPVSRITSKIPGLINVSNSIAALVIGTLLTVIAIICFGMMLKKVPFVWKLLTGGR